MNVEEVIQWMYDYDVSWGLMAELLTALGFEKGSPAWKELEALARARNLD